MRSIFILIIIIYVWSKIIGLIVKTAGGGKNAKKSPQKPVHRNWSQKQEPFVKHQKTVVQPKIILQDNDEESVAERQKAINEMKRKKEIEKRDRAMINSNTSTDMRRSEESPSSSALTTARIWGRAHLPN